MHTYLYLTLQVLNWPLTVIGFRTNVQAFTLTLVPPYHVLIIYTANLN